VDLDPLSGDVDLDLPQVAIASTIELLEPTPPAGPICVR
jgi:hypothetical protein